MRSMSPVTLDGSHLSWSATARMGRGRVERAEQRRLLAREAVVAGDLGHQALEAPPRAR